jgi:hypothetical protein
MFAVNTVNTDVLILWLKTEYMFEEYADMHLCVGVAIKKLLAFIFPNHYRSVKILWSSSSFAQSDMSARLHKIQVQ